MIASLYSCRENPGSTQYTLDYEGYHVDLCVVHHALGEIGKITISLSNFDFGSRFVTIGVNDDEPLLSTEVDELPLLDALKTVQSITAYMRMWVDGFRIKHEKELRWQS